MTSLQRPLSRAFFHHVFTSKDLSSFSTESSLLNLNLPYFLLPSGWEKDAAMQGTLQMYLQILRAIGDINICCCF